MFLENKIDTGIIVPAWKRIANKVNLFGGIMPQLFLPLIPAGTTMIGDKVSVEKRDGRWVYFLGLHPIYEHDEGDNRMFKVVASQLINNGVCRHRDIVATFGVSKSSVNRALKKYREGGIEAFFRKRKGGRRGTVLTAEKLERAQQLLEEGIDRGQVAEELEIKKDTLRKAVNDGRLVEVRTTGPDEQKPGSDKTTRNAEDSRATQAMGTACTRPVERVFASLGGRDGAETRFEACRGVSGAGVLCALPALLSNGLLDGVGEFLGKTKGYYTVCHVLLVVAFMALSQDKKRRGFDGKTARRVRKDCGTGQDSRSQVPQGEIGRHKRRPRGREMGRPFEPEMDEPEPGRRGNPVHRRTRESLQRKADPIASQIRRTPEAVS